MRGRLVNLGGGRPTRTQQAWHGQHPGRQAELAGARAALRERHTAINRYLRAFEAGRLPESTCATGSPSSPQEVQALAARTAELEAACATTPAMVTGNALAEGRRRIERAVADGAPEQLKRLLDSVVDQIEDARSEADQAGLRDRDVAPPPGRGSCPRGSP